MIVFETDFANDQKGVKITDSVDPYAGAKAAIVDSGVANKFLFQASGNEDPHLMVVDGPAAMFSGGRRCQSVMQGWFGTEGLSEQRMFLNADHNLFPSGWVYMVLEWKVRPNAEGSSFRISLRLQRDGSGNWGWFIHAHTAASDTIDEEYWKFENWDAPVPIDHSFVMQSYFLAGDPGKIKIVIEPDGEPAVVVFDLDVRTDSPHVNEVRSCQEWFVQKMYGSHSDFAHVANQGGTPKQYYDWWRFSIPGTEPGADSTPDEPTPDEPTGDTTMVLGTYRDDATGEWVLTWDGVEARRNSDHSDLLDAEKAQIEADNAEALEKLQHLDEAIATL